jgi:predicted ATPase
MLHFDTVCIRTAFCYKYRKLNGLNSPTVLIMITRLHLKNAAAPGQTGLALDISPSVTIFVGPNNSGKSQALREIASACQTGSTSSSLVVKELDFAGNDAAVLAADLEALKVQLQTGESVPDGHSVIRFENQRFQVHNALYLRARTNPQQDKKHFAKWYLKFLTLNLDGPSRIGLVNEQERGDLKNPQTQLARLLTDDTKREKLRQTIYEATGLYFVIDHFEGSKLKIRYGNTPPPSERSMEDETLEYMRNARGIENVSDGVKAYTGILLQLHAGNPNVIIIDEPEAFLHPSLARKLGKEIATGAATEGKHVFVSTHSSEFLMGAILSGAKVNIIRLTYEGDVGTARLLPSEELTNLMQDPLLRSVGVLSGLFYNHVIIGEADADRAFYQEINERLLSKNDARGVPHTLFLNAKGKDTIYRIIEPLRKLGIPSAVITDIDIVKNGGQEWTRLLSACNIPPSEHQSLGTRRTNILGFLNNTNSEYKTSGGIELLSGSEREAADNLFDDLAKYGLFVVRRGEVEAWLSDLSVSRAKHTWLRSIFEKMGSDPSQPAYVTPGSGDVWAFIEQLRTWLIDPRRRGIPQ